MSDTARLHVLEAAVRAADVNERCAVLKGASLDDASGLCWLVGQIGERVQADPKAAEALAEACVLLARRADAHEAAAGANYQWARVLAADGQPDRALCLIDRARDEYVQCGHDLQALRTGLGRMHVLDDFGRHHEAIAVGERIVADLDVLVIAADDNELASWLRGATLENLGVAYGYTDAHELALVCYARAETVYRSLDMPADMARVQANRGIELVEVGRAADGLALLQMSATQFEAEGDRLWFGKCLGHQAGAHMALGNYLQALSLLEQARRCLAELGAEAEATRLVALLAETSIALSLYDEAFDLAMSAATVFRKAAMTHDLAHALRWCGVACMHTNRPDEALALFEEARSLFDDVGSTGRSAETALAIAALLNQTGRLDLARAETIAAHAMLVEGDSRAAQAFALMYLADLSEERACRTHLNAAAAISDELQLPPLSWHVHLRLGRLCRRSRELDRAAVHLNTAVDIIENLQGTVPDEALRAVFLGDKSEAFDELAELLLSLPNPDIQGALAVRERARGRILCESGSSQESRPAGSSLSVDETSICRNRELAGVYNALLRAEGTPGGTKRCKALLDRGAELERQVTIERLHRAAAVDRVAVASVALPECSARNKTVLAYEILGDTIHAFVSRGSELAHIELPTSASAVAADIDDLERQWTHFQFGSRFASRNRAVMTSTTNSILRSLHGHLLAPVQALFGPETVDSTIAVVPSGPLHRVPFNALVDEDEDLLSSRVFIVSPRVAVGPSNDSPVVPAIATKRPLVIGVSDPSMPCATSEARSVASKLANPLLLVDDDATVARLREHAPTASIIHLACHGLHRSDNPLFSSLRLADGWISALDILDLSLKDATVVLSACESGRQPSRGAEPLGLSWAFLGAGAAAVLVSLWTVQDDVASHLMATFYDHLNVGADHAHALRGAQRSTAARWPHPYYWASFVLVGQSAEPSHRRLS
jgi:CHAT domain-containing protein/tetratricopeptide (TPR) repeat protein